MAMYTAPVKLWLTEDKKRVVEDGDPEMAHLFLPAGHQIPEEEARKYGLIKSAKAPKAEKAAQPAEDKKAAKPEDKKAAKPTDKSVKKPASKAKA
jgi:hypothetical protein